MTVLDPRTGAVRWQRSAGSINVFDDLLVVEDPTTERLAGLGWSDGAERWSRPLDATRGIGPIYPDSRTLPIPAGGWRLDTSDHRLVVTGADNIVSIIDARTGTTLRSLDVGTVESIVAIGETLYTTNGREVWTHPLDGSAPTLLRRGTGAETFRVSPCGDGVVCLFSDLLFSVIVLDATTHEELFRQRQAITVDVIGDRVLTPEGRLFDRSAREVLDSGPDAAGQARAAWWLTPGSLLRLAAIFPSAGPVAVQGVSTEDGSWLNLGSVTTKDVGLNCAVDLHYLVCPTEDGFEAWQFANS
jgi:hypothetical protein